LNTYSENIYLSIGSNIGDRLTNISLCIYEIKKIDGFKISMLSSFYETEPVGFANQNNFYNVVVKGTYNNAPEELLKNLQNIEIKLGREKNFIWGPRIIDIDILFFDSLVTDQDELAVPHLQIFERKFVLQPMNEIASEFMCPKTKKTIAELCELTPDKSWITKLDVSINKLNYN